MRDRIMKNKTHILGGVYWAIGLLFVFVMVYKAQIEPHKNDLIVSTVMSEHKQTGEIVMSAQATALSEMFICKVPELKELYIACKGANISEDATLLITLTDSDTGKVYYEKESSVKKNVKSSTSNIKIKLKNKMKDSENKRLILSVQLLNPGDTVLTITSNVKVGIVQAFNGLPHDRTNIIYTMKYSNCGRLVILYIALCIALLVLVEIAYVLIVVKNKTIEQFYIPIAFMLGMIFNCLIPLHGVPDEPGHVDTAYKYSNQLMFVEDTEIAGTIYKRQCDVELQDVLANGVETNSYYQQLEHTFETPETEELIAVSYVDSSNLVPGIIYLPAAIGISIGRMLGLSAFLTFGLGRMMNCLAFILLTWCAIRLIPFGKNMLGLLGILPIAIQQAASFSYDSVVNGVLFLFTAVCFRLVGKSHIRKREWCLLVVLMGLVAMSKSGAYIPVLLLVCMLFANPEVKKHCSVKRVLLAVAGLATLAVVVIWKFTPTIQSLLSAGTRVGEDGVETLYTLSYALEHPLSAVYLYWNTLMKNSGPHLRGLLGGLLGWLDIQVNWVFLVILLIGLLLLVNVEGERYVGTKAQKWLMGFAIVGSVVVIMASMLLSWTPIDSTYISGLQGRYYYVLAPMMLLLTSNQMVCVNKSQCGKIWMVMLSTEVMIGLQVVATVL